MSDEVLQSRENAEVLQSCRIKLDDLKVPAERSRELVDLLERSLEEDSLLESLAGKVVEERDVWHREIDDETFGRLMRGYIFESIALQSISRAEKSYPELERFLLWSLKDPRIWYLDWEQEGLAPLTRGERKQLATYLHVRPDADELHALRNNDAISIDIKTDAETRRTVAVITGVVEAKNHRLLESGRDELQMRTAPDILVDVVTRYKKSFPLLMKGLDLGPGMPDEIAILPADKLSYTIVQPVDLNTATERATIPPAFAHCRFEYVPVTREEVAVLAEVVGKYIKPMLSV